MADLFIKTALLNTSSCGGGNVTLNVKWELVTIINHISRNLDTIIQNLLLFLSPHLQPIPRVGHSLLGKNLSKQ